MRHLALDSSDSFIGHHRSPHIQDHIHPPYNITNPKQDTQLLIILHPKYHVLVLFPKQDPKRKDHAGDYNPEDMNDPNP